MDFLDILDILDIMNAEGMEVGIDGNVWGFVWYKRLRSVQLFSFFHTPLSSLLRP